MEQDVLLQKIESGDVEGFLNSIDQMAASKAYLVIRDEIASKHIKTIKDSGKDNYQKFQDIKIRAKESWDYDHKVATMADINRACMNVYTLVLRLMRAQNDSNEEELNKIKTEINKIEEKVGLEPTIWEDTIGGGNDNVSNEQGIEESI